MTRIYCTIFNSLYLIRALALHASLVRHQPDHRLYVFAMDALSAKVMRATGDPRIRVVEPAEFEDAPLTAARQERSIAEYFWTCTPSIIRHCLLALGEPECTYLDADLWLFSDPEPLFAEMGSAAVLLTDHRYTRRHDRAATHGRYCVQFMRFTSTSEGLRALDWWRERCNEWCYARVEPGRFGDQKYLDDWPTRFPGVHVLRHAGGGVAPWNVADLAVREGPGGVQVSQRPGGWQPLVFYHFHGLRSYSPRVVCYGYGYSLSPAVCHFIYRPYVAELQRTFQHWLGRLSGPAMRGIAPAASSSGGTLRQALRRIWGLPYTRLLPSPAAHG